MPLMMGLISIANGPCDAKISFDIEPARSNTRVAVVDKVLNQSFRVVFLDLNADISNAQKCMAEVRVPQISMSHEFLGDMERVSSHWSLHVSLIWLLD